MLFGFKAWYICMWIFYDLNDAEFLRKWIYGKRTDKGNNQNIF